MSRLILYIFVADLAFLFTDAAPSHLPFSASVLSLRSNTTDDGSTPDTLLTLDPIGFDLALPWWTQVPGTTIDLFVGAITGGNWKIQRDGIQPASKLSLIWNWFTTLLLFFQSLSGLIYLAKAASSRTQYSLGLVQHLGANSFAALFANAIKLWDQALLQTQRPFSWRAGSI